MSRYFTSLFNLFKMNPVQSSSKTMLGRWNLKNKKHEDMVTFWANSDHCGDTICGNPRENKKFLDTHSQVVLTDAKKN